MSYQTRNAKVISEDASYIDCEWNHPVYGWIPFTAYKNDSEKHGREIWEQLSVNPDVSPYTPPSLESLAQEERAWRDGELTWFDQVCYRNQFYWTMLSESKQSVRMAFRQALLDYPEKQGFPTDLTLRPTRPVIED